MAPLQEAWFYERLAGDRVHCTLCPHDCRIADGSRGACAVRFNERGTLYTLVYDAVVGESVEPIEKKPLFHFLPGSTAYSLATVGCNLQCTYCQNWSIAQWPRANLPRRLDRPVQQLAERLPGRRTTSQQIVEAALRSGASSVAYTFTEPTIYFELAYDTATRARAAGLKNLFVTNGYISEAPLRQIGTVLDAANIDLKFFREGSYRRISRAGLQPVLDAIRLYHQLGVWIEITTLVIPGVNDSDQELREIAAFIVSIDRAIPWHVSRFYPDYKMRDRPATPVETLLRAREIGTTAGLKFVYTGNVPGERGENTVCPECGTVVIERFGCRLIMNRLRDGRCPACDTSMTGVFDGASAGLAL